MQLLGFIGQVGEKTSACEHRGAILRRSRDLDEPVCGDTWRTLFDRRLHVFLLAVSSCIRCCVGALSRTLGSKLEQPEEGSVYVIEYFGVPARRRGEFFATGLSLREEVGSDEGPQSLSIRRSGANSESGLIALP